MPSESFQNNQKTQEEIAAREVADLTDGSRDHLLNGKSLREKRLDEITKLVYRQIGAPDFNDSKKIEAFFKVIESTARETDVAPRKIASVLGLEIDSSEKEQALHDQLGDLMGYGSGAIIFNRVADQMYKFALINNKQYEDLDSAPQFVVGASKLLASGDNVYFTYKSGDHALKANWSRSNDEIPAGVVQANEAQEKIYFIPISGSTLNIDGKIDISGNDDYGLSVVKKYLK